MLEFRAWKRKMTEEHGCKQAHTRIFYHLNVAHDIRALLKAGYFEVGKLSEHHALKERKKMKIEENEKGLDRGREREE